MSVGIYMGTSVRFARKPRTTIGSQRAENGEAMATAGDAAEESCSWGSARYGRRFVKFIF